MPRPLHDTPIESSAWWACFQPERPVDGWCVYDLQCPKCAIKADVDLVHDPQITAHDYFDETDAFPLGDRFGYTAAATTTDPPPTTPVRYPPRRPRSVPE